MSDENRTDNPYQPPALRDEPLAKKDANGPKAKLHPVHWLLPILGYVYVPPMFILNSLEVITGPTGIGSRFSAFSCSRFM